MAPASCGGQKEFWTWLVAIREGADYQRLNMVYLHHIHWKIVFDCVVHGGTSQPTGTFPATSGAILIGEGVGQGGATPVFTGRGVLPQDEVTQVEKLPDGEPQ